MALDWKKIFGGGGRNDPYLNEKSMFAARPKPPRKYFSDGSMPKGKKAPVPIARPTDPTTAALAAKAYASLAPPTVADRVANATSPSSLMGSTADAVTANATSPSSLVRSPSDPYAAIAREMPDLPYNPPQAPYPSISSDKTGFPSSNGYTITEVPPEAPTRYPTIAQDQNYLYQNELPPGPNVQPRPPARAEEMNGPPMPGNMRNAFGVNPGAQGMPSQRLHQIPRQAYPTVASDQTGFPRYPTVSQDQTAVPERNWPSVDQLPPAQDPGDPAASNGFWWQQPKATQAGPFPGYATNPQTGVRTKIRASNLLDLIRGGF